MQTFLGLIDKIVQNAFASLMWNIEVIKLALTSLLTAIGSLLLMLLDFIQDCFKKLAGLDTYYYEGSSTAYEKEDILQRLLTTKEILQAFGALVVVGIILLFLFTIIQMIRVEYTTDGAKNSKGNIISQALKALAMFVIIPIGALVGIFFSNKILQLLDKATSPVTPTTIAGTIFRVSYYDANPARSGEPKYNAVGDIGNAINKITYMVDNVDDFDGKDASITIKGKKLYVKDFTRTATNIILGLRTLNHVQIATDSNGEVYIFDCPTGIAFEGDFESFKIDSLSPTNICPEYFKASGDELASNIDYVFSHRGLAQSQYEVGEMDAVESKSNGKDENPVILLSLNPAISLFVGTKLDYTNPAAVCYFYNQSDVSFFLEYVTAGFAIIMLYKAAFGMVMRLYMCCVLFIIAPPIIAMAPIRDKALGDWKSQFIGQVLAGYGTVVALNIFMVILPIIERIQLFNENGESWGYNKGSEFLNNLVQVVFILVGCLMLKDISKTISGFIGAKDAAAEGEGMSKSVTQTVGKIGAVAVGAGALGLGAASKLASFATGGIAQGRMRKATKNKKAADNKVADAQKELKDAINVHGKESSEAKAAEAKLNDAQKDQADATSNIGMVKQKNAKLDKFTVNSQLTSRRFGKIAKTNTAGLLSKTAIGEIAKASLGDAAPEMLGGKGFGAYDKAIAGESDTMAQAIKNQAGEKGARKGAIESGDYKYKIKMLPGLRGKEVPLVGAALGAFTSGAVRAQNELNNVAQSKIVAEERYKSTLEAIGAEDARVQQGGRELQTIYENRAYIGDDKAKQMFGEKLSELKVSFKKEDLDELNKIFKNWTDSDHEKTLRDMNDKGLQSQMGAAYKDEESELAKGLKDMKMKIDTNDFMGALQAYDNRVVSGAEQLGKQLDKTEKALRDLSNSIGESKSASKMSEQEMIQKLINAITKK